MAFAFLLLAATLPMVCHADSFNLTAWGSNAIRIRVAPPGAPIVEPPLSALLPLSSPAPSSATSLVVGNLKVTVDAHGNVVGSRVSDEALLFSAAPVSWGTAAGGSRPGSVSASLTLTVPGVNAVYGGGEHLTRSLDFTNYSKRLETSQLYSVSHGADILIPFYMVHPLGLGFFWNSPSYGSLSVQGGTHVWTSSATRNVDFWVTVPSVGQTPATPDPAATGPLAKMLSSYTAAVGRAIPMPSYVAGFWQCKNRYRDQNQLLDVARGYVNRSLPLDIITIDYMHWTNFGDWSFNPKCWPDPQGMVNELKAMGVELAVTFWPHVTPQGAHFQNFNQSGFLAKNRTTGVIAPLETWAGDMYLTDETNPAARCRRLRCL